MGLSGLARYLTAQSSVPRKPLCTTKCNRSVPLPNEHTPKILERDARHPYPSPTRTQNGINL